MLKISPVFDTEEKEKLCTLCGAKADIDALTYSICEDGSEIGVCQFKFCKDGGRIILLRNILGNNDKDALIIAGKAALDFIERNSGKLAYFDDTESENTARRLGFRDGKLNLEGYFDGCCGNKSEKEKIC